MTPPPSRPIAGPLPPRKPDGSYPFREHRSCAEWMTGVRKGQAA